ncbi:hypothetical protein JKP88DRAFT_296933 [Tribonema minus]|uniref:RNA polymerase sigma-70 region 2 domain-containing protein n=1 Tax=Tribonema minus TaxID=303371 RepID=A0A835ZGR1_9STRA|nr:hypothetical protein JKP88DRAFT_296933 [Tribonema minus]
MRRGPEATLCTNPRHHQRYQRHQQLAVRRNGGDIVVATRRALLEWRRCTLAAVAAWAIVNQATALQIHPRGRPHRQRQAFIAPHSPALAPHRLSSHRSQRGSCMPLSAATTTAPPPPPPKRAVKPWPRAYEGPASSPTALGTELSEHLRATRLLTPAEELRLGALVRALVALDGRRAALAVALGRVPTARECADDAGVTDADYATVVARGRAAKAALVACNLRLVALLAARAVRQRGGAPAFDGPSYADLVQEGALGLARAAEKFEPERGLRFSTYATWWIRQRIQVALREHRLVRVPANMHLQFNRLRAAAHTPAGELGRAPNEEELAAFLGVPRTRIAEITHGMQTPASLDAALNYGAGQRSGGGGSSGGGGGGSVTTLLDKLAATQEAAAGGGGGDATAEQSLEWDMLRSTLEGAMATHLTQRERDLVRMLAGLDDGRVKTAAELAAVFGVPTSRMRREVRRAMTALRRAAAADADLDASAGAAGAEAATAADGGGGSGGGGGSSGGDGALLLRNYLALVDTLS